MTNQAPIKEFRAGSTLSVAIWRNETQENGKTIVKYSMKFQKRYCDDEGNWKNSDYYFPDELPKVAMLANKAFEFIYLKNGKNEADASA